MISENDLLNELKISKEDYLALKHQLANDPTTAGQEEEILQRIARDPQALAQFQQTQSQLNTKQKRKYTRRKNPSQPIYGQGSSGDRAPRQSTIDSDGIKARNRETRDRLSVMYQQIGIIVSGFNQVDGHIIITNAHTRATELVRVGQHHKELMKVIRAMTEGNDYIACAVGYMSMVIAILANHNKLPENVMSYLANIGRSQNGTDTTNQDQ